MTPERGRPPAADNQTIAVPHSLDEAYELLRRANPSGVPAMDYESLLLVVAEEMSEEGLGIVVAELTGGDPVVVVNDAAAAHSVRRPADGDLRRVRDHLAANGWPQELSRDPFSP